MPSPFTIILLTRVSGCAFLTEELDAQKRRTPLRRQHPGPQLPWRIVPHMLPMAAFEVRDPMTFVVGVKTDDPARYRRGRVVVGRHLAARSRDTDPARTIESAATRTTRRTKILALSQSPRVSDAGAEVVVTGLRFA